MAVKKKIQNYMLADSSSVNILYILHLNECIHNCTYACYSLHLVIALKLIHESKCKFYVALVFYINIINVNNLIWQTFEFDVWDCNW